jgi:uncharacterized protein (TIGR02145 family)
MKRLLLLLTPFFFAVIVLAQSPEKFSYQAVIRNATNQLVTNHAVGIRISILQGTITGTSVYVETHAETTNANGLVTLAIGGGAPVSGSFSSIDWHNGPYFLKTETDPTGGSNYSITGTSQLLSVPYALHARTAEATNETDPVFTGSVAAGITGSDTAIWNQKLDAESDPLFNASVAAGIMAIDTAAWNAKLATETDPVFTTWDKSSGITITESQITNLQPYLTAETDPLYNASVAKGITSADTANWNAKITAETDPVFTTWDKSAGITITESQITNLQSYLTAEADPLYNASVAKGITSTDTANWNAKITTETDPVFTTWDKSSGINITESQITNLQPYLLNESDPDFNASVAAGITGIDTAAWNKKVSATPGTPGEILFWNGSEWITLPPGIHSQVLTICNGVPKWGPCDTSGLASVPTVITDSISSITPTSAVTGGNVTSDGGATVTVRGVCWSTSPNPTIANTTTNNGTGTGTFMSNITGLSPSITYYVRAYATNSVGTAYGNELTFTTLTSQPQFPVYDIDGNGYDTVNIGSQVWLKQNLKTTRYNDGAAIPNIIDSCIWSGLSTGAMCWYNNDSATYGDTYGALYNWYAVVSPSDLCPTGWHVPTDIEWQTLEIYLGMTQTQANSTGWRGTDEGGKMKDVGTTHWNSPNAGATNSSGFTALPGGWRAYNCVPMWGSFGYIGENAYFWTSTTYSSSHAWIRDIGHTGSWVSRYDSEKNSGFSVRCIMDSVSSSASLPTVTTDTVSFITSTLAVSGGSVIDYGNSAITSRGVCWSTTPNPTISDSTTSDGIGSGTFTSTLTGLTPYTTYYLRAYATNSVGTAYGNQQTFATNNTGQPCPGIATFTDYNGNIYNTVQIGNQCWMKENLKVRNYNNGFLLQML